MSTTEDTLDRQDAPLRALLASIDPESGAPTAAAIELLDRVLAEPPASQRHGARRDDPTGDAGNGTARPGFWERHWQGTLLVAAGVATLALAGGTVLGPLGLGSGGADSGAQAEVASEAVAGEAVAGQGAPDRGSAGAPAAQAESSQSWADRDSQLTVGPPDAAASDTDTGKASDQTLVRSGTVLVGTDDQLAGRDSFVTAVTGMGGRVLSEAVVTEGGQTGVTPMDGSLAQDTMGVTYPYPWWPSSPGIWLTVQVPAERYDEAMTAARTTGEVVSMQQSSYDVGTQVADVDARIKALEDSLRQLQSLMDKTTSVSEVIKLEAAISQRQAELDGLKAQQRELANQTQTSQISLTLMSPKDAAATVDPQPTQTWWESFVAGLSDAWAWLGKALMILSPLLIATAIIAVVRRRRRRGAGGPGPAAEPEAT